MKTVQLTVILCVAVLAGCTPEQQASFNSLLEAAGQGLARAVTEPSSSGGPSLAERIAQRLKEKWGLEEPKNSGQVQGDNAEPVIERIKNACEPGHSEVRSLAVQLAAQSPGPYNIKQTLWIWCTLRDRWRYVNDPRGFEYFAKASESAKIMAGDCDDFAILLCSMLEGIGARTRIVLAQGKQGGHAYVELYIGQTQAEAEKVTQFVANEAQQRISYRWDNRGYWLNYDWSAPYPGGPYFQADQQWFVYLD